MINSKETKAPIKINKLLDEASWRFGDSITRETNVRLEENIKFDHE
jgi:hypothetical protein